MHREIAAGYGSKHLCTDCGDNVGNRLSASRGSSQPAKTGDIGEAESRERGEVGRMSP